MPRGWRQRGTATAAFALLLACCALVAGRAVAGPGQDRSTQQLLGDTTLVGRTWWDDQRAGSTGRTLYYLPPAGYEEAEEGLVWTLKPDSGASVPFDVMYTRRTVPDGLPITFPASYQLDGSYASIVLPPADPRPVVAYHSGGDTAAAWIAQETVFVPDFFLPLRVPGVGIAPRLWPSIAWGPGEFLHSVTTTPPTSPGGARRVHYLRWWNDTTIPSLVPDTAQGGPLYVTGHAVTPSATLASARSGGEVALAVSIGRQHSLGEGPPATTANNDIWLWTSEDSGATWDFTDYENVTGFTGPDVDLLPDSALAARDTLRAVGDLDLFYDHDDRLHLAFTVQEFDLLADEVRPYGRIYHWDDENELYTQLADGADRDAFLGVPEPGAPTLDKPTLYDDPETGILWCVFRRASSWPDTNDALIRGGTALANADVHVTASPPGPFKGLLWARSVNITHTVWEQEGWPEPGQSRSESDPGIALDSDGSHLRIAYLVDRDPGRFARSGPGGTGGSPTRNEMVIHRVAKQALLDAFEEQGEWVVNDPLRVSELDDEDQPTGEHPGHWEDPADWLWDPLGGFFTYPVRDPQAVGQESAGRPVDFTLDPVYPNPFNASARVSFQLERRARARLALHDLLGREVAVLLERAMTPGRHQLTLSGGDLPSGLYLLRLSVGSRNQVRKVVLLR